MERVKLLCRGSIFGLQVALQQRHDDVRPCFEQVDRLDEALHDVHHKVAVGSDQLPRGRKYGWRIEGRHRKSVPTVQNLPRKAHINRQRARVDLSGCQRGIDSIESNQGQVNGGYACLLDCDPGRHAAF
jgi:hypothetical protein